MPVPFSLPPLPYADTALEPYISSKTLGFHHGKHHKTYIDTLNKLCDRTEFAELSLEDIVQRTAKDPQRTAIFNNAAQAWNHAFFWESLAPKRGGIPAGKIGDAIARDFGGYEKFKADFLNAALTQFGSGWVWLVTDASGKLSIEKTGNAATPISEKKNPLLTIDVWEHAYYLDYQNRRADFVSALIDNLLNWDKAEERAQTSRV